MARTAVPRALARASALALFRTISRGSEKECPCCGSQFARFVERNSDRICPRCRSNARNRILVLYLTAASRVAPGMRVLHLAPEPAIHRWLSGIDGLVYVTGDLEPGPLVQRCFDAHSLPFPDDSFDLVLCSHVLEHVRDDVAVVAEFARVLADGGEALIQIPVDIRRPVTDEDASVVEPAERIRRFGQWDHVRRHGRDVCTRLARAGVDVERVPYESLADDAHALRHELRDGSEERGMRSGDVYRCRPVGTRRPVDGVLPVPDKGE